MKKIMWIQVLIIMSVFISCSELKERNHKKNRHEFPVTKLITRNSILYHKYVGQISAFQNVEIRARVPGFLEKIYVDEGQEVKKGQALFRINSEEYNAELAKAKAMLKTAIAEAKAGELQVERVRVLVEKSVVSKTELEVAQANYDAVNAGIETARSAEINAERKLSYTYIKSPFNGIIDRIPFKVGSLINEGSLLTTASDLHAIYVYFNVSESDYLQYIKTTDPHQKNKEVELFLADGTEYPYKGKIETMAGEFNESTGSIAFRAKFPNPNKLLKHGSSGVIRISNSIPNALLVPQKACFEVQDKNYVYVVEKGNKVKIKSFIPKSRFKDYYIVESGLKAGEKIVYEGLHDIKEGMEITMKYNPMDSLD
jgi:membrane fusion protein (multidrug efflux system)